MKAIFSRNLVIGLSMLAAAGLALALTPRLKLAEHGPNIELETMIPNQFGEWKLDETIATLIVSPDIKAQIDRLYSQTLARTYVNKKGERIMLSITYGDEQTTAKQIHLPENCYPAQGFKIKKTSEGFVDLSGEKLPVMRLVSTQGPRVEPITYWAMIGDSAVRGRVEKYLARLKYGLTGEIPSGILVRVSSISADESQSYITQEQFLQDMLTAVPLEYRKLLTGVGQ